MIKDETFMDGLYDMLSEIDFAKLKGLLKSEEYDTDSLLQDLQNRSSSYICLQIKDQEAINAIFQSIQSILGMCFVARDLINPPNNT